MEFWYTKRVSYFLVILCLALPFHIMYQYISSDRYTLVMLAALWQFIFSPPDYLYFYPSPFGLVYIIWYGPSVYIAKMAYDAAKKGTWSRYDYVVRAVIVVIIQVAISVIIPPVSGYPPPLNIPLPIPGIVAIILTKWTVKEVTEVWEEPKTEDAFEPTQSLDSD